MRIRPSLAYRVLLVSCLFVTVLFLYHLLDFRGAQHVTAAGQRHLYITINKDRLDGRFPVLKPKRILAWTEVFGENITSSKMSDCPGLENRCLIDTNPSLLSVADAVLFHGPDFGKRPLPPVELRSPSQRYVFMTMESPANTVTGKRRLPKNYFNWTMTPLFSSDVIFKYGSFWLTAKDAELRGFKLDSFPVSDADLVEKVPSLFALISNCHTQSKREDALAELAKYMNVTIAGDCGKSVADRAICPKGESCRHVMGKYAFFLAAENSACVDYVSEKYWDRFDLPSIPIVLRRKDYRNNNIPEKSIIAMDDYPNAKAMADHLNLLMQDKDAYREYFAWRRGGWTRAPWNTEGFRNGYCRLCERLWEKDAPETVVGDVLEWYRAESDCDNGQFVTDWIHS